MPDVPATRTTGDSAATHVADHNIIHAMNNAIKAAARIASRALYR